jgi:hypothetical protein
MVILSIKFIKCCTGAKGFNLMIETKHRRGSRYVEVGMYKEALADFEKCLALSDLSKVTQVRHLIHFAFN